MFMNVIVKNKRTGKILETEKDGLYVNLNCEADGSFEIDDIGTCVDNSTYMEQDTEEKQLNPDDFELVSINNIDENINVEDIYKRYEKMEEKAMRDEVAVDWRDGVGDLVGKMLKEGNGNMTLVEFLKKVEEWDKNWEC